MRALAIAAAAAVVSQVTAVGLTEQIHIALTGKPGEMSVSVQYG